MNDLDLKLRGAIGILAILGLAFLLSNNKGRVRPRIILFGLGLQIVFALFVLKTELGARFFSGVTSAKSAWNAAAFPPASVISFTTASAPAELCE